MGGHWFSPFTFLSGLAISGSTAQNGFTNSRNFTEKNKKHQFKNFGFLLHEK